MCIRAIPLAWRRGALRAWVGQKWAAFLVFNPVTGTLKAPDGSWWVDQTYFHGRPVPPNQSIVANVEAPRAGGQLFYQFDPLFHDNTVFSLHPRSDAVR